MNTIFLPKRINPISFFKIPGARDGINDFMDYKEEEKKINENNYQYTKKKYEEMGIKIINEMLEDSELIEVKLPEGWKKQYTDHSMWTNIINEKGDKVFEYFYKSNPWDREAFSNI